MITLRSLIILVRSEAVIGEAIEEWTRKRGTSSVPLGLKIGLDLGQCRVLWQCERVAGIRAVLLRSRLASFPRRVAEYIAQGGQSPSL